MSDNWYTFISLDLPALLTALFAGLSSALVGNFLVLRRESLMGDAISHSVLPGIVLGFLISGTRDPIPIFLGAAGAGIAAAILIETVGRLGKIESGTSMGVIFSIFFAAGIVMIEFAEARNIDLDADCILHGQLEHIFWLPPEPLEISFSLLKMLPAEVFSSLLTLSLTIGFLYLFHKELLLASFDSELCDTLGFRPVFLHQLLMSFVALTVVVAFKAVGSILVIAMLICPAASARLYTDRFRTQLFLTALFAFVITPTGYFLGTRADLIFGFDHSLNAAGMMAVTAGLVLLLSVCFAPGYGLLARLKHSRRVSYRVDCEDLIGVLYRVHEKNPGQGVSLNDQSLITLFGNEDSVKHAARYGEKNGLLTIEQEKISLTDNGRSTGALLVRTHRLLENYLVNYAGFRVDHVHHTAHRLEHYGAEAITGGSAPEGISSEIDPHGQPIPKKSEK